MKINHLIFCFGLSNFNIIPLLHMTLNFLGQHYTNWIFYISINNNGYFQGIYALCQHTISHLFQFAGEMSNLTFINSLKITYIPIILYMPTLPIYVAVYRIFKSSTAYRFYMFSYRFKKKECKKIYRELFICWLFL